MVDFEPEFSGQQTGERVLHRMRSHPLIKGFAYLKFALFALIIFLVFRTLGMLLPSFGGLLRGAGIGLALFAFGFGAWWIEKSYQLGITFITDRRIVRFEPIFPGFVNVRSLFWNEVQKAKGYPPNIVLRLLGVGVVEVEPSVANDHDIRVTDVPYYHDIVNYIDKILFLFKNRPNEIEALRPFIAKPAGMRY